MSEIKRVGVKDLDKETRRLREETRINPYISFTHIERPLIKAQINLSGTGARDLADMEDFAKDLQKAIDIVKTFKYEGYELDYNLQDFDMSEKYVNENKTSISQPGENKTSDAQIRAVRNWEKNNADKVKYMRYKSFAKTFARYWADDEDMKEVFEVYKKENPNCNLA